MRILKKAAVLFTFLSVCVLPYSAYAEAGELKKASIQYPLHVAADHGTVTSRPAGIQCGSDCSGSFAKNTAVTLSASAHPGYTFIGWSDSRCGEKETCTIAMTRETSVSATFSLNMYNLSVHLPAENTGSGSVRSTSSDISCGADCSEAYPHGTLVTLTATADSGSTFLGWTGNCSGTSACRVTMDAVKNVGAIFAMKTAAVLAGDLNGALP